MVIGYTIISHVSSMPFFGLNETATVIIKNVSFSSKIGLYDQSTLLQLHGIENGGHWGVFLSKE